MITKAEKTAAFIVETVAPIFNKNGYAATSISDITKATGDKSDSPIEKLSLIADFYRNYYLYTNKMGGCPILNVGVDANNQNSLLLQKVRTIIQRIQDQLATIIENGIECGEISTEVNAMHAAKRMDTMIQGAIFMAYTMGDDFYIQDTMNQIDYMIQNELKA